jgi:uncharacterized protein YgiM (DUF1202 family)
MKKMIFPIWLLVVFSLACLSSAALEHGGGGESSAVEAAPVVSVTDEAAPVRTSPTLTKTSKRCAVVIADDALNLRAAASANDIVLAWLDRGDVVEVIGKTDPDWWRVRFEGVEGFARSIYLQDSECVR